MTAKLSSQCVLLLDYMKRHRQLTNLIALTNLGIGSLSSRIAELRRAGHAIKDQWQEDHFGRRFKKYWIAE